MIMKQQDSEKQTMTTRQITENNTENRKIVDFATLYKTALKVMRTRKQVIDGLKDK